MRGIITVIGNDKVGIIAGVSTLLAAKNVNILDITQTVMQDIFTMIMLVDLSKMDISFTELKDSLNSVGENLGISIRIQREDTFNSMHRI
ncbi:hypothetical protein OXPF_33230 [Oxobacter pfennigii]|uniref:UPF0237 protein OXPF_33230 n=1 Tax=Oxobacter pfennigii TaxID=36849 RepID=A0A0P8YTP9_9CLOT|nr:ACT domain-containing protein [Oxobacter pfennigii]KPU43073.1 hypothetical protein OXPF_33230 [Oxobacter pfennigii]